MRRSVMVEPSPARSMTGVRSSLSVQPLELTQKTARSRVMAAAWMGSSCPGITRTTGGSLSNGRRAQPDRLSAARADIENVRRVDMPPDP